MLEKSLDLSVWIAAAMGGATMKPVSDRQRVAAACFSVVQDHHTAIVFLIKSGMHSPATCLVRSTYEGFIRGAWLAHCASDAQVQAFIAAKEPPVQNEMIAALELLPGYDANTLSLIRAKGWKTMCNYAHVGGLLVMRWIKSDSIEANFDPVELDEILVLTGVFALFAAMEIASLCQDDLLAEQIHEKTKTFSWHE